MPLRRRSQQQVINDLAAKHGPEVAQAFAEAIADIRSRAEVQRIIAALAQGRIEEALEALHLDPAAFDRMAEALRQTFTASGNAAVEFMPRRTAEGLAAVHRFSAGEPVAADWLRRYSSDLITRVNAETREAVREHLSAAMARGQNPTAATYDLVGRINRVTGRREGGIVGLSGPQAEYVRNAREELASSDPAALRKYLTRARIDKRFNPTVKKAIRDGKAISAAQIERMMDGYKSGLLKYRGDLIGLTEARAALAEGREQAYLQAIAAGRLNEADVTKAWRHLGNPNPRHDHLAMNGRTVGIRGQFLLPDGTLMKHPHDPSAPIRHRAGCHCQADYRVDFFASLR